MVPHNRVCLRPEDEVLLACVVQSGQIGQGPQVRAFEAALVERFRPGAAAVCVSSGTAALHLLVQSLAWQEVTIPTYACISLFHAVSLFHTVRMLDCDADTFNSPSAHVVVHTYGVPSTVAPDAIEDFTHAVGGRLGKQPCGSLGIASVVSFGATKPLGCGAGGAVLGPSDLIEEIRDRRDYDGKRQLRPRFNWQMSDLTAALGLSRLERLDDEIARRREIASRYEAVCRARGIAVQGTPDSTWYRFVMRVSNPQAVIAHFAEDGVEAINPLEPWEPIHKQMGYEGGCPMAEAVAASTVSLPVWPGMTRADEDRVLISLERLAA
jgi:dTDP-4-amino-4,6-dideoxygalactose transaminase